MVFLMIGGNGSIDALINNMCIRSPREMTHNTIIILMLCNEDQG